MDSSSMESRKLNQYKQHVVTMTVWPTSLLYSTLDYSPGNFALL